MSNGGASEDPLWRALESFGIDRLYVPSRSGPEEEPSTGGRAGVAAPGRAEALERLRETVGDCTRCPLSESRNRIVMGEGNPSAGILLVGEGPGRNEDETGKPFVGRAGKLLDRILAAIELDRDSVYITNVVKCRPPGNRTPSDSEISTCYWILEEQVRIMEPGVICALGAPAARTLTGLRKGIGVLRNSIHRSFGEVPVLVTYHPAALLRSPALKRPVWEDMKKLRDMLTELGLPRREP